ncbi:MAG TPA: hypothetical protein IAB85_06470 [Candidatus Coprenecus merdigallinarum]|nr:hypothetical protein [Candidatus Coprenecus merdigallinarum]
MRKIYTLALVIAAVLASMPLYGQSKGKHPKWVDYTGTHEVDVSVGFPTAYALAYMADMNRGVLWLNNWAGDIIDRIDGNEPADRVNANAAGGDRFIPNLRAEYGYNVLSWLNVGVAVNYSGCSRPMEDMDSGQYLWTENTHLTTVTAKVKFYWLNRKWVRMYSSVGAGVGVCRTNLLSQDVADSETYVTTTRFTPDICLVGLTVGRNLYGRIEWGTLYGGLTAGIGYRF